MGCAVPHPKPASPFAAPVGKRFPDVSSFQGHPNWALAKPFIDGAAVKASEFRVDPDFVWNVHQLNALHIPWVAYDFVRSCSASVFIAALKSVGGPVGPPIIDMEVPAAKGCAPALERQIFAAFHRLAIIYSAPGSWPGGADGGLSVWVAAYGPSSPPCLFTCNVNVAGHQSIIAWQYTDGQFGAVTTIPGIPRGDVSIDYNLMAQATPAPAPKPKPVPAATSAKVTITLAFKGGKWAVTGGGKGLGRAPRWFSAELQLNGKTGQARVHGLPFDSTPLGGK